MTSFLGTAKDFAAHASSKGALLIEEITCVCGILYVESPFYEKRRRFDWFGTIDHAYCNGVVVLPLAQCHGIVYDRLWCGFEVLLAALAILAFFVSAVAHARRSRSAAASFMRRGFFARAIRRARAPADDNASRRGHKAKSVRGSGRCVRGSCWRCCSMRRLANAHSPTYDEDCPANCCAPRDGDHTFSQAFYLKGDGGVELHLDDVDIKGGETIHWDVVFRGEYQERPLVSDFELYVGCGKAPNDAYIEEWKLEPTAVLTPKIEPFTQTSYYPLYKKDDPIRKFDASRLADCPAGRRKASLYIRLKTLPSAKTPIYWAPVLGCPDFECEVDACAREIFMFPYYILHNQRAVVRVLRRFRIRHHRGHWHDAPPPLHSASVLPDVGLLLRAVWRRVRKDKGLRGPLRSVQEHKPRRAPSSERVCEMIGWPYKTMFTRVVDHYWRRKRPTDYSVRTPRDTSTCAVFAAGLSLYRCVGDAGQFLQRRFQHCVLRATPRPSVRVRTGRYDHVLVDHRLLGARAAADPGIHHLVKATNVPESRWRRFFYGGAPNDRGTDCCSGRL